MTASPLPSILLASTGKPFDPPVLEETLRLAQAPPHFVHVMSIARIWGTALGLQHPGLYPTKREWEQQREIVGSAVGTLERAGLEARGGVIASRNASRTIAREAARLGCSAIVMGYRPLPTWMVVLLQDEVRWVTWRSKVPVVPVFCEAR